MDYIVSYLARFAVLLFILPAHEFAHAFAARINGDDTAKNMGRYTLNPFKHFDPIGLVCFLIVGFGWAKPVPVNPYNYKDYKKGSIQVAVAGVSANYILAFLFYPLMLAVDIYLFPLVQGTALSTFVEFLFNVCLYGFMLDLSFFAFNLIPVYPLDGFRLLDTFVKRKNEKYFNYKRKGYYVLLALMLLSAICSEIPQLAVLDVFGYFMEFCVKIVGYPISFIWDKIFGVNFRSVLWKIIA